MENASIDGTLRPRPPRRPRGPLYDFNLINPERLARQRAQVRRRLRLHLLLLLAVAAGALGLVPLRGRAHVGPRHQAAAYAPSEAPAVATGGVSAASVVRPPTLAGDVQYLRAPDYLAVVSLPVQ